MASATSVLGRIINAEHVKADNGLGSIISFSNQLTQALGQLVKPFTSVQTEVINLTKALGLAGTNVMAFSERLIAQNKAMSLSMSYGVSNEEMLKLQQKVLTGLDRNVSIDMVGTVQRNENGEIINPNFDSELENLVSAYKVFGDEATQKIVAGFDHIGMSMNEAAKTTGKLYQEAGKYGINLQKYSKNFTDNLSKVQTYGFKNGVKGLQEMARKATEIRQNMEQTFKFADKVGSVTGAVEAAANLQVLGGSFTALANPLAMLNESLTNVEGLQERMNNMAKGRARYNQNTHQIEMDPVTRMQMRRAAESMGIDPENFIDTAYAQARRQEIERQVELNGVGGMREDTLNLLKNVGTINSETGVAGATINGKFQTLGEIAASTDLQDQLIAENKSQSDDIKDIAKSVLGIEGMISGRTEQFRNQAAENKIRPGVAGPSLVQSVTDTLNYGITPEAISAVGKLQFPFESTEGTLYTYAIKGLGEIVSSVNASSFDEFLAKFGTAFTNTFGTSPFATEVLGFLTDFLDTAATIAGDINAVFTQLGFDLSTQATAVRPQMGREGSPTGITESPMAPKAIPVVVVNPGPGNGNAKQSVNLNGNNQSMPGASVYPGADTGQAGGQNGGTPEATDVNLNISGTLTMNVNGDNGTIGEINLIEMIEKNPTLRNEIARMIAEALAKQNRTMGLPQ